MGKLLDRVRGWWRPAGAAAPTEAFELRCTCGQGVAGRRQRQAQVIPCPRCRQPLFVLALSPLPPPGSLSRDSWLVARSSKRGPHGTIGEPQATGWKFWRWPLLAAGLTLLLATAAVIALIVIAGQRPTPPLIEVDPPQLIRDGDAALAAGQLREAAEKFQAAATALDRQQPPPIGEVRRLRGLARQALLLDDLLDRSLAELVDLAAVEGERWPESFARRYRGKGVVFDAEVRRDLAGHFQLGYHVRNAAGEAVQVELDGLKMLELIPQQRPGRLLFGARMASVGREDGGFWVVRFEPDSGVLLTDERLVEASCPPPADEAELKELLRRQAAWAADTP